MEKQLESFLAKLMVIASVAAILGALALAFSTKGHAADLGGYKNDPSVATPGGHGAFDWRGAYIEGAAGAAFSSTTFSSDGASGDFADFAAAGVVFDASIGYRFHASPFVYLGIWGDLGYDTGSSRILDSAHNLRSGMIYGAGGSIGFQAGDALLDFRAGYAGRHSSVSETGFSTDTPGVLFGTKLLVPFSRNWYGGVDVSYAMFADATVHDLYINESPVKLATDELVGKLVLGYRF